MQKIIIYTIILIISLTSSGCWWGYVLGISTGANLLEGKAKREQEIAEAVRYEKYKKENERRAGLGLPPIEDKDIPKFERKRSGVLY